MKWDIAKQYFQMFLRGKWEIGGTDVAEIASVILQKHGRMDLVTPNPEWGEDTKWFCKTVCGILMIGKNENDADVLGRIKASGSELALAVKSCEVIARLKLEWPRFRGDFSKWRRLLSFARVVLSEVQESSMNPQKNHVDFCRMWYELSASISESEMSLAEIEGGTYQD